MPFASTTREAENRISQSDIICYKTLHGDMMASLEIRFNTSHKVQYVVSCYIRLFSQAFCYFVNMVCDHIVLLSITKLHNVETKLRSVINRQKPVALIFWTALALYIHISRYEQ